jgi:molecular chaperone DnaK
MKPPAPQEARVQPPPTPPVAREQPPSAPPVAFESAQQAAHRLPVSEPRGERVPLPLLVDVTPLSLCVETVGGYRDVIITRNTPVPCETSRKFVTARDMQETVLVRVGQGESARFEENTVLGELELSGLRAAPRGGVQIVVAFSLDTDGMLEVRATDAETGRASTARLRLVGLPDADEVGRMTARHLQHPSL